MTTSPTPTRLSKLRFAFLVLIGIYPILTGILYFIFPLTTGWAIWQRTFLVAPLMVAIMIWGVIPFVHKAFREFINPAVEEAD